MTLAVSVSVETTRLPISRRRVAAAAETVLRAERVRDALLSITFLSNRAMARMNADHLGHRGATDVISFAFAPAGPRAPLIGDVYIAPAVARANAHREGVGVRAELVRLVVHGVLHVLGYDHPEGAEREHSSMWRRQERLVHRILRRAA